MGETKANRKVANGLVALSSAAVMAVYGAGYARTRAAADRVTAATAQRRAHVPVRRERSLPSPGLATATTATHPAAQASTPTAHATESVRKASPKPATPDRSRAVAAASAQPSVAASAPALDATEPAVAAPAADAAPVADAAPAAAPAAKYRDGTYVGWGTSPHGDIQAAVIIEGGRITTAKVAQCLTRYSCAWVAPIPPVIIEQQGTTYDYVSGATESSDAFQNAVADALSHAS